MNQDLFFSRRNCCSFYGLDLLWCLLFEVQVLSSVTCNVLQELMGLDMFQVTLIREMQLVSSLGLADW